MKINATLIGQMITFALFVWFTYRFVWPPIIKALKDRQSKIADGLAAAERGHVELEQSQAKAAQLLKEGKDQGAQIVLEAQKQADRIVDAARQQAHDEGLRIIQQAQAEVEHMIEQAREGLRKEIATIAMLGAQKVLEHSVDEQAHTAMLEKLAQEL